jgi:hypothetical protein
MTKFLFILVSFLGTLLPTIVVIRLFFTAYSIQSVRKGFYTIQTQLSPRRGSVY